MARATLAPEVTLWTDAMRAPLVAAVLAQLDGRVQPIGVGGPRAAAVTDLAKRLDCPYEDDLRKLVVERPASFLLLATMQGLTADEVQAVLDQGVTVLSIEPVAAGFDELTRLLTRPRGGRGSKNKAGGAAVQNVLPIVRMPNFFQSPGWLSAADPAEVLGPVRSIAFSSLGGGRDCSLLARLQEAWEVVLRFGEMPTLITAALTGRSNDAGDEPRAVSGHLCVQARMPQDAAAVLQISDQQGRTARGLNVCGDSGQLRVTDLGYELLDADGRTVDERRASASVQSFAELVAEHWRRLLEQGDAPAASGTGSDPQQTLACTLATLLSTRTGQPERPDTMMQMHLG